MLRTRSEGAVPILVALGVLLASAVAAWGDIGVITFSGREVFRGLFFGRAPAAPRLHDLRSAALRSGAERRAFWMSEEVTAGGATLADRVEGRRRQRRVG